VGFLKLPGGKIPRKKWKVLIGFPNAQSNPLGGGGEETMIPVLIGEAGPQTLERGEERTIKKKKRE